MPGEKDVVKRAQWGSQVEFTLSLIGYAVGIGNIWRFPYLCMRNGGGAFLIPYFIFLLLNGIPLFYLELCLGQFSSLSPLRVWAVCPLAKGLGWCMIIVSAIVSCYFGAIMTWAMYFLGMSLRRDVPWKTCDNDWNTANCTVIGGNETFNGNTTWITGNGTNLTYGRVSAAEEFWSKKVLDLSDGMEHMGGLKWDLVLCLFAVWLLIFLCVCKGVKSSGKVVYLTAILPYVLLLVLLVRGATLPGSLSGIKYYIIPNWSKLLNFKVWMDACLQVFFSLGPAWGGIITMASYNTFHHNILRDAIVVSLTCGGSSLFGGFAIFSTLGYMAHSSGKHIEDVVTQGPGLAFIAYPEAISRLPISPLWSVLFFLMIITIGIDMFFGTLETVISGFLDEYPRLLGRHKLPFTAVVCLAMFVCGLPFVTRGGMYLFQVIDWYSGVFSVMVIAISECVIVGYVYGIGRFFHDIRMMLGSTPSAMWAVFWCGINPLIVLTILLVSAVAMVPPTYGSYVYPAWAEGVGWLSALASILPLPGVAIYSLVKSRGSLSQRLAQLLRTTPEWGPNDPAIREQFRYRNINRPWRQRMDFRVAYYDVQHGENLALNANEKDLLNGNSV